MSERETYPPGVPCWVDTLGPNPGRLTEFYGAIFGWDFAGPGAMPGDGSPGEYHVARLRGRDVAGIGSLPAGAPPARPVGTHMSGSRAPTAPRRMREPPAAPSSPSRSTRPPQGGWRSSPIPRARPSAYGRRATVRARSSSTSRGRGA